MVDVEADTPAQQTQVSHSASKLPAPQKPRGLSLFLPKKPTRTSQQSPLSLQVNSSSLASPPDPGSKEKHFVVPPETLSLPNPFLDFEDNCSEMDKLLREHIEQIYKGCKPLVDLDEVQLRKFMDYNNGAPTQWSVPFLKARRCIRFLEKFMVDNPHRVDLSNIYHVDLERAIETLPAAVRTFDTVKAYAGYESLSETAELAKQLLAAFTQAHVDHMNKELTRGASAAEKHVRAQQSAKKLARQDDGDEEATTQNAESQPPAERRMAKMRKRE